MMIAIKGGDNREVFKYEQLDETTADFLRIKESNMREIVGKAYTELGRELSEAQAELSKNGYGCFEAWCKSIGFQPRQARRLIDRFDLIRTNCPQQDLLEDLPVSLTYEISAPSAESTPEKAQAKEEVLAGDISTGKAYKERIAELERIRDNERKERERLEGENEELQQSNEELYDRLADIPKSEKSKVLRSVDEQERQMFYKEFANDLSYIAEKYGSIIFDGDRLKEFGSTNEEYANKVNKFDDFWKGYVKSIIEDVTIIDMEVK